MKFIINLIILFFATTTFSQNAEAVLKSLQNKFNSINSLSVNVTQKANSKSALTGKMYFKKENNIRVEFTNQLIVSDGKTSWNYNKKDKKVIISDYDDTGSGVLSINYLVYQYPSECNLSLSSEDGKQVLILTPKSKRNNFGEVKLFINKDNLIDKIITSNQGAGAVEILFSNYSLNPSISDSQFSFTPPEGTSIVDLR